MYLKHIPSVVKPFAKDLIFDLPNDQNAIYLTFDDGPHPEITEEVLDLLDEHKARATFFLIGENVRKFPQVVERIKASGHAIGLHGNQHLSGWKTKDEAYFADIASSAEVIHSNLMRPPYGEITLSQAKALKKEYKLIMWSDLSADFDASYSSEQCFAFATKKVKAGSIIVFHDNEKAKPRIIEALRLSLAFYRDKGFCMEPIQL
ncbi:polysaccharide deacetylase family protein [bacterium]|nr:polysaccharide deacetylase family protein [bacterium]